MSDSMRKKLTVGFTLFRWGIDFCYGGLLLAVAIIIPSIITKNPGNLFHRLLVVAGFVLVGLVVSTIGRVIVGLQSRKLNLHTDRPFTDEERWFVRCMITEEEAAAKANLANSAARITDIKGDNVAAGFAAGKITHSFNRIGKRYRSRNILLNRCILLVSLVLSAIVAGVQLL